MPRKNPIAESEAAICGRVNRVRAESKLTRIAFAHAIGADSSTLANIEHNRAPLRYGLADKLCALFNVNQRWLAEGLEPVRPYIQVHEQYSGEVPAKIVFSHAYKLFLRARIGEAIKISKGMADPASPGAIFVVGVPPTAEEIVKLRGLLKMILHANPPQSHPEIIKNILSRLGNFSTVNKGEIAHFVRSLERRFSK